MLSKNGEMRRDDGCLDFSGGENVIIYPCHGQKGNQEWLYREVIFHTSSYFHRYLQSVSITTKVVRSNPVHGEVYLIQHYVIKFVSDLRHVCGFLQVLWFPPPIKLTATI
jgi:hypothetical protein